MFYHNVCRCDGNIYTLDYFSSLRASRYNRPVDDEMAADADEEVNNDDMEYANNTHDNGDGAEDNEEVDDWNVPISPSAAPKSMLNVGEAFMPVAVPSKAAPKRKHTK